MDEFLEEKFVFNLKKSNFGLSLFALCLFLTLAFASTSHGRQIRLFEFLKQTVQLPQEALVALKAGEAITLTLPSSPKNELSLFGAVRVNEPLNFYFAKRQNHLPYETKMVQAWGQFSVSPTVEDLNNLSLPTVDLEDLPICQPGRCKIKLPPGYIEKLSPFKGDKAQFVRRANTLLRRTLVDYLNDYKRRGNAALMEYRDRKDAVSLADEFDGILENFSHFKPYLPGLQSYLKNFPHNSTANTEDRFIWAKVLLGGKAKRPIIFLYHLVRYRIPGGNDTVIAVKQLYASHYYEGSLGLTITVADPSNESRFYLLHFDRGRIDVLRKIPAFLAQGLKGQTSRLLTRRLEEIKEDAKGRF